MNFVGFGKIAYLLWLLLDFIEFVLSALKGMFKVPIDPACEYTETFSSLSSALYYKLPEGRNLVCLPFSSTTPVLSTMRGT